MPLYGRRNSSAAVNFRQGRGSVHNTRLLHECGLIRQKTGGCSCERDQFSRISQRFLASHCVLPRLELRLGWNSAVNVKGPTRKKPTTRWNAKASAGRLLESEIN